MASGESPSLRTELILTGIVCSRNCYFANVNIEFIDESFQNNNQTCVGERYSNLDLFICNHKS